MGEVTVRDAVAADVDAIVRIGREAVPAQYAGLVDPAAVAATVEQTYSPGAVTACIERCAADDAACFLVAERDGAVVAYLHFDAFGPEPELHRIYTDAGVRSSGAGSALIRALHDRLPDAPYMLLVVEGNDRAVGFYERHGLHVEQHVDGLRYYRERMGVVFPPETAPFSMVLMRRAIEPPGA